MKLALFVSFRYASIAIGIKPINEYCGDLAKAYLIFFLLSQQNLFVICATLKDFAEGIHAS